MSGPTETPHFFEDHVGTKPSIVPTLPAPPVPPDRVSEIDLLHFALVREQLRSAELEQQAAAFRVETVRAKLDTIRIRIRETYALTDADTISLDTGVITRVASAQE